MSKWFRVALGLVAAIYLVNCFTPLRLHVDMLRYFAIKDCVELGCPADSDAAKDYLPWGYTALLLLLSKCHLLHSFTLVFINCLYLFGGLYLVKKMIGPGSNAGLFLLLVLLNWTMIKFVMHPLSEMQYLFFSMLCLYFFCNYASTKNLSSLLFSFAAGGLAFLTRSVGISLIAALVAGLIWLYRKELLVLIRKNKVLVILMAVLVIGVAFFSRQLGLDHYTSVFHKQFTEGVTPGTILKWHFTEWSELFFNISIVKLFSYLSASIARLLFFIMGIVILAVFCWLLFTRARGIPFILKAYLVLYTILMFEWPFYDPRFWVPVFPLVVAVIIRSVPSGLNSKGRMRVVALVITGVYLVLGIVSAGYLTYTSLDRRVMARTHANGVYRNEYETVFFGEPQSDTARHIDPAVLSVIRRYN